MNKETKKEEKESPSRLIYTRKQTGIRILATLFFGILIWQILEVIIMLAVIFQIISFLSKLAFLKRQFGQQKAF